ncbi:MAG: DUF1080 domain-containing protein, partial [Verrucomicrobia bacterium]|nr:DUF1080 domain-containing protein [Verrucomicrobiota bacterium]
MKKLLTLITTLPLLTLGLSGAHHLSKINPPEGFVALFDGKSMDGWYSQPSEPQSAWNVDSKQGILGRVIQNGYLWTEKTFGNFILDLEYKTSKHCNSGVFFRTDPNDPVQHGFEIQILDSPDMDMGK